MEYGKLALEYFRVILSWPTIFLILGFVFLFRFHAPISDFIRRLVRGEGPGGIKFTAEPSRQINEAEETPVKNVDDKTLQENIRSNPQVVLDILKKTFNAYWFERHYNLIYGSQIRLLEHLISKSDKGDKYGNLHIFYSQFQELTSNYFSTQYTVYLKFLETALFIEIDRTHGDSPVKITPLGIDFISYIKSAYLTTYQSKLW